MKTNCPSSNPESPLYHVLIIQERGHHEANRDFRESLCLQRAFRFLECACDVWGKGHNNFTTKPDFDSYDLIVNLENYGDDWLPDLSKVTNPLKMIWCIDAHVRGEDPYEKIFHQGKYDLLAHASSQYAKGPAYRTWLPNCVDPCMIYKMEDVPKIHNMGFCGNYVTPQRRSAVDTLASVFGLKRDIFVIGSDMVRAINSYKIHFNMNIAEDVNYRNFETMSCGTLLFTGYHPDYARLGFVDGQNCVLHDGTVEGVIRVATPLMEMARTNHPNLQQMANNGRVLVLESHTFVNRAKQMLEWVRQKDELIEGS